MSENVTLGGIADQVAATLERELDLRPDLNILHRQDVRNYKVSGERARVTLGFKPAQDVRGIVENLVENRERFEDFGNPAYSNIATFRALAGESGWRGFGERSVSYRQGALPEEVLA